MTLVSVATKRRPIFAMLIDYLGGDYQMGLISAAQRATQRLGYDLLVVVGRSLSAPEPSSLAQNDIYNHLDASLLDGIIVGSGCIGIYEQPAAIADFCKRYGNLPICSISTQLPGIPSLVVSNYRGMKLAVDHLIEEHGCQRIAYIRGPLASEEAEERFQGYLGSLKTHGLAYDPNLLDSGNFWIDSGAIAMQRMLDRGVVFDALAAANDYMALGAMKVLKSKGIRVPHAVRVVGFDDVASACVASPSLTTVRQPLLQLGRLAIDSLREGMNGNPVSIRQELDVEMVHRQSCGCGYRIRTNTSSLNFTRLTHPVLIELAEHRQEVVRRTVRSAEIPPGYLAGWAERIVAALHDELLGKTGRFLLELEDLLDEAQPDTQLIERFYTVIVSLRAQFSGLSTEGCPIADLDDIWHAGLLLVGDAARRSHLTTQHETNHAFDLARRSIERLSTSLSHSELAKMLDGVLTEAQIRSAAVSLYTDGTRQSLSQMLVHGRTLASENRDSSFPSTQLAPTGFFDTDVSHTYIVMPISYGTEHLGITVMEGGCHEAVYSLLREHIGAALKGAALHRSVVQQTALRERAEREKLQKETAIAQQIQTAILPQQPQAQGLEIAAHMLPATSVGGDYYDVLPDANGAWIGFGDVTGHGLLSGLIMLMIQSMVRASVSTTPEAKPSSIVMAINRALYANVRHRLGLDEHATFTLIRFNTDGMLTFSGAHEEILICRALTGHCERITAPGIWLGAIADVTQLTSDSSARLEVGDVLVLYSDGITESMNSAHEQFGVDRLISLIDRHHTKPASELCELIMKTARDFAHSQLDDMTLLIARYVGPSS